MHTAVTPLIKGSESGLWVPLLTLPSHTALESSEQLCPSLSDISEAESHDWFLTAEPRDDTLKEDTAALANKFTSKATPETWTPTVV